LEKSPYQHNKRHAPSSWLEIKEIRRK